MASAARKAYIRATGRIENAMTDLEEEGGQVAVASVASWFIQEEEFVSADVLRAELFRRMQADGSLEEAAHATDASEPAQPPAALDAARKAAAK